MAPKILVVLTSADKIVKIDKPTGWYLPEFAHPYDVFSKSGAEIVVASPNGGAAPLDQGSVEMFKEDPVAQEFLKTKESLWKNTEKLSNFVGKASEFDALFFPGGHGPMYDLATDETSHKVINEFAAAGKVVSAVCHGPAAFVFVKKPDGTPFLAGKKVTSFTDSEEKAVELADAMPFLLETELRKVSKFSSAGDWASNVVVDGKVITGQNPASSAGVGEAILKAISA